MAGLEACDACGREISGDLIPKRVLGRVLCPPCDQRRVEDINRRDRSPVLTVLAAAHALLGLLLLGAGTRGFLHWWAARSGAADGATIVDLLTSLLLFPLGALFSWTAWNLWRLEGRGRMTALLLDSALSFLCVYWLLDGHRLALLGLAALFSVVYLSRSASADRFW